MKATEWAAWVGASTGVVGLSWQVYTQVYTWLHSGPRLRVLAVANFVKRPAGLNRFKFCPINMVTPLPGEPKFLRITVEHSGDAPTTIQKILFETYPSRWATFSVGRHCLMDIFRRMKVLHYLTHWTLAGGFVAHIEQDEDFNKWASSGNLWFAVLHSCSTWPALGKAYYPKE